MAFGFLDCPIKSGNDKRKKVSRRGEPPCSPKDVVPANNSVG